MKEIVNLEKLNSYGLKQPANNPNYVTPDNITHCQLRYNDFTSNYVIQGLAVGGSTSTFEFDITENLNYYLFKLFVSTDGTNYTESKSYGGSLGKTLLNTSIANIILEKTTGETYTYDSEDIQEALDEVDEGDRIIFNSGEFTMYEQHIVKPNTIYYFREGTILNSRVVYNSAHTIPSTPSNQTYTFVRKFTGEYAITEREVWTLTFHQTASASFAMDYALKTLTINYVAGVTTCNAIAALVNANPTFALYFETFASAGVNIPTVNNTSYKYVYNLTRLNSTFVMDEDNETYSIVGAGKFTVANGDIGILFYITGNSDCKIHFSSIEMAQNIYKSTSPNVGFQISNGYTYIAGETANVLSANSILINTAIQNIADAGYKISIRKMTGINTLINCDDNQTTNDLSLHIEDSTIELNTTSEIACITNITGNGAYLTLKNCMIINKVDNVNNPCISFSADNNLILLNCSLFTTNLSANSVLMFGGVIQSNGTISNTAVSGSETVGTISVDADFILI